jgi:hypothetical protein
MTDAAVATNGLKALQVAGEFTTEVALDHPFVLRDNVENLIELLLRKGFSAGIRMDAGFGDHLISTDRTDAVDVTEGIRDFLLRGNFYTEETWHRECMLVGLLW